MAGTPEDAASTFVLIPGAWMGSWSWFPVARQMRQAGYDVLAITMPGLSYQGAAVGVHLADAVDHVVSEIQRRDLHRVILVAHSWGGYPATGAAHQLGDRVDQIIYHSAVVPDRGVSMVEENQLYAPLVHEAIAASSDGTIDISLEAASASLTPGEPPAVQELVHALMVPQPGAYMTESLDVGPVTDLGLRAAYVLADEDIALARPGAEFAARLGLVPITVPGGHMAMLTHPTELAAALLTLARGSNPASGDLHG